MQINNDAITFGFYRPMLQWMDKENQLQEYGEGCKNS